jgi:hypothetical protein
MRYAVLFEKTDTDSAGMVEDGEPIPVPKTIAEYFVAA